MFNTLVISTVALCTIVLIDAAMFVASHFVIKQEINIKDPTLVYYVKWFQEEATKHGLELDYNNLVVKFDNTATEDKPGTKGYCQRLHNFRRIVLDINYFARSDEYRRKALVAHEMGHCVLNRRHYLGCLHPRGYLDNGCEMAASIMYPYISSIDLQANEEYYLYELFSNYEDMEIPYFE